MKNVVPLIVSVVLGLAAVFVVSQILMQQDQGGDKSTLKVVVAAKSFDQNDEIHEGTLAYRSLPADAVPKNALLWENVNLAYGQVLPHSIAEGEFILFSDIRLQTSLADCVQSGNWTVPVTFSDPVLVSLLKVDDEIAIIQTRGQIVGNGSDNLLESENENLGLETTVLLPCVRILGFANSNGRFRSQPAGGTATIFVSLPPQQAMLLMAAQRQAELFPALRKRNDPTAINRKDGGVVNANTFNKIRQGLKTVDLPEIPDKRDR